MSASLPYIKFFPSDWLSDERLILASLPAKGLWICLLALMAKNERRGYLAVNGGTNPPLSDIARLVGSTAAEVEPLLEELKTRGVCSVEDGTGILFSRRLVRDTLAYQQAVEIGKTGGNPRLKGRVNPPVKGRVVGASQPPLAMAMVIASGIFGLYPRREGKASALKAIVKALNEKDEAYLKDRVTVYALAVSKWPQDERKYIPHASRWFNDQRYEDDPTLWEKTIPANSSDTYELEKRILKYEL